MLEDPPIHGRWEVGMVPGAGSVVRPCTHRRGLCQMNHLKP